MKALLVLDVQKGYMKKYDADLINRINQRIQYAVENKELIVFVKNVKKLRSGTKIEDFAEGLNICSSNVVYKETASALSSIELLDILKRNQVTEIEIVGVDGNSCVASTAMDAQQCGYQVTLQCQYIGIQNVERFEQRKLVLSEKGIAIV